MSIFGKKPTPASRMAQLFFAHEQARAEAEHLRLNPTFWDDPDQSWCPPFCDWNPSRVHDKACKADQAEERYYLDGGWSTE